jgi:hypothetical protein
MAAMCDLMLKAFPHFFTECASVFASCDCQYAVTVSLTRRYLKKVALCLLWCTHGGYKCYVATEIGSGRAVAEINSHFVRCGEGTQLSGTVQVLFR